MNVDGIPISTKASVFVGVLGAADMGNAVLLTSAMTYESMG